MEKVLPSSPRPATTIIVTDIAVENWKTLGNIGKHWETLEKLKTEKFDPMIVMEDACPAAPVNNRSKGHL